MAILYAPDNVLLQVLKQSKYSIEKRWFNLPHRQFFKDCKRDCTKTLGVQTALINRSF